MSDFNRFFNCTDFTNMLCSIFFRGHELKRVSFRDIVGRNLQTYLDIGRCVNQSQQAVCFSISLTVSLSLRFRYVPVKTLFDGFEQCEYLVTELQLSSHSDFADWAGEDHHLYSFVVLCLNWWSVL